MLRLNLIAEEAKKTIKYQRLYHLFLGAEFVLLIIVFLVGALFFSAETILAASTIKFNQETSRLLSTNSADYNSKAKELNDRMATVAQIEKKHVSYSQIYHNIADLIPANISLSHLDINSNEKEMVLWGIAPTRQDLLDLETSLKNAPWLVDVNIPLEEKLNKTNISLDITLKLDLTKIPQ
jgi:Tfp pilus assembly protein PilN